MRETLHARLRSLSQTVENAMNATDGATLWAVALADWVIEEARAVAEEAERDERAYWEAGQARTLDASKQR